MFFKIFPLFKDKYDILFSLIILTFILSLPHKINCCFLGQGTFSKNKEKLKALFPSGGFAPGLRILNGTYSGTFHFNLTLVFIFKNLML